MELFPEGVCARVAEGALDRAPCWSRRAEVFVAHLAPRGADPARSCPADTARGDVHAGRPRCWVPVPRAR